MNRIVLVLNVVVLLVNFVLSLSATDSQIGILETTSRAAGYSAHRSAALSSERSVAYLRVSEALESALPRGKAAELTSLQRRTLFDAVDAYYGAVNEGVTTILGSGAPPAELHKASLELSKGARTEVERVLLPAFPSNQVARLATEIIRSCG